MNRRITNIIRHVMDEWIPPAIRDSKWFMYPFYWLAYRGKNLPQIMNLKATAHHLTSEEFANLYRNLDSISRRRETDLNSVCLGAILKAIPEGASTLLDLGCGNGYLLRKVLNASPGLQAVGFDVVAPPMPQPFPFIAGRLEHLPFGNQSFDIVTCTHTLEHVVDLEGAISELLRVARHRVIIVVPKQRWFFYTLDEHLNFFPYESELIKRLPLKSYSCQNLDGDWLYIGDLAQ